MKIARHRQRGRSLVVNFPRFVRCASAHPTRDQNELLEHLRSRQFSRDGLPDFTNAEELSRYLARQQAPARIIRAAGLFWQRYSAYRTRHRARYVAARAAERKLEVFQ